MSKLHFSVAAALMAAGAGPAPGGEADATLKKGAMAYRQCAACHSLKPDVHLSGPSLAGLWGKRAASIDGYGRYTDALKDLDMAWDEDTLNAWLADPQAMAPGTTMTLRGIESDATRAALITFLRRAMPDGGSAEVVNEGLVPENMAEGPVPPDLSETGDNQRISNIRHCRDGYFITTADGAQFPFWETNVRLKIDTSVRGPEDERPILLRSGMAGDRVSVVFSSMENLRSQLREQC